MWISNKAPVSYGNPAEGPGQPIHNSFEPKAAYYDHKEKFKRAKVSVRIAKARNVHYYKSLTLVKIEFRLR